MGNVSRQIVLNRIKTPDGTILTSRYVHDYQDHKDANGHIYTVDGGWDYLKRSGPDDYEELSVYADDPFELIRVSMYRGNRGINGDQPLKWVRLCDMSNEWLEAIIIRSYVISLFPYNLYIKELDYRKNIKHKILM